MEQGTTSRSLFQSVAGLTSAGTDSDATKDETRSKHNDVMWTPATAVSLSMNFRQQDDGIYETSTGTSVINSGACGSSSTSSSGEDTSCVVDPLCHHSDIIRHDPPVTRTSGILSQLHGGMGWWYNGWGVELTVRSIVRENV